MHNKQQCRLDKDILSEILSSGFDDTFRANVKCQSSTVHGRAGDDVVTQQHQRVKEVGVNAVRKHVFV